MPGPDGGIYVEVEFTPGSWTDITSKVELGYGITTKFGRQTPYSAPAPSTLQFTLNNDDGRFTAGRQGMYWPNVRPGVRVRYGWIIGGQRYPRGFGYVSGWPTTYDEIRPRISVDASDRLKRFARAQPLPGYLEGELLADGASAYWSMTSEQTNPFGTATGPDIGSLSLLRRGDVSAPLTLGDGTGIDPSRRSSAKFAPSGELVGEYLASSAVMPGARTIEASFYASTAPANGMVLVGLSDGSGLYMDSNGKINGQIPNGPLLTSPGSYFDLQWHHAMVTNPAGTGGTARLYVDGVLVASVTTTSNAAASTAVDVTVGGGPFARRWYGNIGHVALIPSELSQTRAGVHGAAATGYLGERLDQRVARLLALAGVPAGEMNIDVSRLILSWSPQKGLTVPRAMEAMTNTEGGGSVFYCEPDPSCRFTSRDRRKSGAPNVTLDAVADIDGDVWSPDLSEDQVENTITVNTPSTGVSNTLQDPVSIGMFGLIDSSAFDTYIDPLATGNAQLNDATNNAQDRLNVSAYPQLRLGQVRVDLWTAENAATLYPLIAASRIGTRLRVTNLPPTAAPANYLDVVIEGWTENVTNGKVAVTFDTSPDNTPADLVWGDDTFGRWQGVGQTLTAGITATGSTLRITTPDGGATYTTDPAMYPLKITVGAERITLNGPPDGAASPQTFASITRGADGTTAAAQTAGAAVDLFPISTWTL